MLRGVVECILVIVLSMIPPIPLTSLDIVFPFETER